MYRLVSCTHTLEGSFLLKVQKGCLYVIMLKTVLVLLKFMFFDVKKGISGLVS